MNEEVNKLRMWLESDQLLLLISTDEDEINEQLELRDAPEFDLQWVRVANLIKERETDAPTATEDETAFTRIREMAFKQTFKRSGSGELAEYVCDDFDLLARARRLKMDDFWLEKLWSEYQAGRFPHGKLV